MKCGRPKGQVVTVIGLPRKRKRTGSAQPFAALTVREKKLMLLTWFTGPQKAAEAMVGNVLDEDCVEQRPECIPSGIRDENIDINLVRHIFTDDAWEAVQMAILVKKQQDWKCNECDSDLDSHDSIFCDWCLCWSHVPCVGLKQIPKAKLWKCQRCLPTETSESLSLCHCVHAFFFVRCVCKICKVHWHILYTCLRQFDELVYLFSV